MTTITAINVLLKTVIRNVWFSKSSAIPYCSTVLKEKWLRFFQCKNHWCGTASQASGFFLLSSKFILAIELSVSDRWLSVAALRVFLFQLCQFLFFQNAVGNFSDKRFRHIVLECDIIGHRILGNMFSAVGQDLLSGMDALCEKLSALAKK